MEKTRTRRIRNEVEARLDALMRRVVDSRASLEQARGRLRDSEQELRGADPDAYKRQRERALGAYIEAIGRARLARTELLQQLRDRAA
ncbi:MAG TPA: hypothetical protein VNI02_08550 [Blastocatellia bacterium]|jgi:hypothetical protein|nr:hypothetical protein [Blastocatellia bacterium]